MKIPRCQHIKVNGTQCGSPALRDNRHCYFHSRNQLTPANASPFDFPLLEDANAVQMALMQVIRAIADGTIENKRASLLLYALQTASFNLKRATFEPETTNVVLDPSSPAQEVVPAVDPIEFLRAMNRHITGSDNLATQDSQLATPSDYTDPVVQYMSQMNR